jgi:hypothetical protein
VVGFDDGLAVGAAVVGFDETKPVRPPFADDSDTADKSTDQPSDLSADKPTDQTSDLSAEKPTDQPSNLSADKPTDQPSDLSDSVFNDAENDNYAPVAAELGLGFDEGLAVGELVGFDEGLSVGESVGFDLGIPVGESFGFDEGLAVGECDKYTRGVVRRGRILLRALAEEATEAAAGVDADRARMDGFDQGIAVGELVGFDQGIAVGEGLAAGVLVGFDQGIAVGEGLAVDKYSSSDSSSSSSSSSDNDDDSSTLDFYEWHKDYCEVCGHPGFLLCCATCNIVSHMHCAGLQEEPLNDWMCAYCLADDMKKKDGKEQRKATQACREIMERMSRECMKATVDQIKPSSEDSLIKTSPMTAKTLPPMLPPTKTTATGTTADRKSSPELEHPFKTIPANPELANKLVVIAKKLLETNTIKVVLDDAGYSCRLPTNNSALFSYQKQHHVPYHLKNVLICIDSTFKGLTATATCSQ